MGREIRKVPPNWQHPKSTDYRRKDDSYQPMFNRHFDDVFTAWLADFDRIRMGALSDSERECYPLGLREWLNDEGRPPDPQYYRPYKDEEAIWFQMYETVSEGTPVTPSFSTKKELVDYLCAHGDFWDQSRGNGGWSRQAAEKFVDSEWAPSMIMVSGQLFEPRDGMPITS